MNSRFGLAAAVGLLVGMLGLVVSLTPLGMDLEESAGLHVLFHLRGPRPVPPGVTVVALDQESAEALGLSPNPLKWPRSLHARLTSNLSLQKASVVVFDVLFSEPTAEEDDDELARAVKNAGNVVLCEHLRREAVSLDPSGYVHIEKAIPPIDRLADAAAALAPFPLPKVPVRVSRFWTFKTGAGCKATLPVAAFQIHSLQAYTELVKLLEQVSPAYAGTFPPDALSIREENKILWLIAKLRSFFEENPALAKTMIERLNTLSAPEITPERKRTLLSLLWLYSYPDSLYLNFYGPPGSIPTISFHKLLNNEAAPDLSGKAVFIGLSETLRPEQRDGFNTTFSKSDGTDLSGVEIAATAFANMLENMPIRPLPGYYYLAVIFLYGFLLGACCFLLSPMLSAAATVGAGLTYVSLAAYHFASNGTWIPVAVPLLLQAPLSLSGTLLWNHFRTRKERENVRKAFGFFLPGKVIDQVIKDMSRTSGVAHSQAVFGTILATDGEQYTSLSEKMRPAVLNAFLNRYFESIFIPVKSNHGTVSDIIGDSMLAAWTTTHPDLSLRRDACRAAFGVLNAVEEFNKQVSPLRLNTRIGLHYGELLLGTVGGFGHYEYRPVGDVVNTASRVENLNKHFGTSILVSEPVIEGIDDFLTRELGCFLLSGKSNPVTVYELICPMEEAGEEQAILSSIFSEGLRAFENRSWDRAIAFFQECLRITENDEASSYYLKQCLMHKENPPSGIWNGVVYVGKV
ncbi:MAG: CHASE2 domain-containing protein [Syntrophobacteraceae bacterium]